MSGGQHEEDQALESHQVIELQTFSERKAWITEKIKFLEKMPPIEVFVGLDAIRSSSETVPGLPTREELQHFLEEHDRIEKETEIVDSGELMKLRMFTKAATQRHMSPEDTDLIELTLTTIFELDKLLHLLRDRSENLDLLGIRLTWEEQRTAAWVDRRKILADLQTFLDTRARWNPSVYVVALKPDESSLHRRGSVASIASMASIDSAVSAMSPAFSRSTRFKLAELLSRDAAQFASRISAMRHSKIIAAGKALDKLIDSSHKPVPEELLDEQDKLEEQGINALETVGKFTMHLVMQWRKADEIYVETMKDHLAAQNLLEEIEIAEMHHPSSRQSAAFVTRADALMKRLQLRGNPASSTGSFPRPTHPLFPDQPSANEALVRSLSSEVSTAMEVVKEVDAAAKKYRLTSEAVRDVEALSDTAKTLSKTLASAQERFTHGVDAKDGDGSPPDLTSKECLEPTRHAAFLTLLPDILKEFDDAASRTTPLLRAYRAAVVRLDRPGIDATFKSNAIAEINQLGQTRDHVQKLETDLLARVGRLRESRRLWDAMGSMLKNLDDTRREIGEAMEGRRWRMQAAASGAPLTPESPMPVLLAATISTKNVLERLDDMQDKLSQQVAVPLAVMSKSLETPLHDHISQSLAGLTGTVDSLKQMSRLLGSIQRQTSVMKEVREEVHNFQIQIEDLKIQFDTRFDATVQGVPCNKLVDTETGLNHTAKELHGAIQTFTGSLSERIPFVAQHPSISRPGPTYVKRRFASVDLKLGVPPPTSSIELPFELAALDDAVRADTNMHTMRLAGELQGLDTKRNHLQLARLATEVDAALASVVAEVGGAESRVLVLKASLDGASDKEDAVAALETLRIDTANFSQDYRPHISRAFSPIRETLRQMEGTPGCGDRPVHEPLFLARRRAVDDAELRFNACHDDVASLQSSISEAHQAETARLEALRIEHERLERERLEEERLEQERIERERAEKERLEAERLERERATQERLERERLEQERIERVEKERLEAERLQHERAERERLEKERLEQERLERVEKDRLEAERLEHQRVEQERLERERLEQERVERELAEKERLEAKRLENERAEQERLEKERLEQERVKRELVEKERMEAERLEHERVERERLEKERLEQERVERELAEKERLEAKRLENERAEQERLEKERLERERVKRELAEKEKERMEAERLENERAEQEHLKKERLEQERIQRADKERLEAERLEHERVERERLEKERIERERVELERLRLERLEKERIERECAEKERWEQQEMERLEMESLARERIEQENLERERFEKECLEQEQAKHQAMKKAQELEANLHKLDAAQKQSSGRKAIMKSEDDVFSLATTPQASPNNQDLKARIFALRKRLGSININGLVNPTASSSHDLPSMDQRRRVESLFAAIYADFERLAPSSQDSTINTELHSLKIELGASAERIQRIRDLSDLSVAVHACDKALSDLLEHIDSYPSPPTGELSSTHITDVNCFPEQQLESRLTFTQNLVSAVGTKYARVAIDTRARAEKNRIDQTWGELRDMCNDLIRGKKSRPPSVISSGRNSRSSIGSVSPTFGHVGNNKSASYSNLSLGSSSRRPSTRSRFLSPAVPPSTRRTVSGNSDTPSRSTSRLSNISSSARSISGPMSSATSTLHKPTFASRQRTGSMSSNAAYSTPVKTNTGPPSRPRAQTNQRVREGTLSPTGSDMSSASKARTISFSHSRTDSARSSSSASTWSRAPRQSFPMPTFPTPPRKAPPPKKEYVANPKSKLDMAVGEVVNKLPVNINISMVPETWKDQSGKYWIGEQDAKLCFCRILRSRTVMVRVGGGWSELSKFIQDHFADLFRLMPESPPRPGAQEEKWISSATLETIGSPRTPPRPPKTPEPRGGTPLLPSFSLMTPSGLSPRSMQSTPSQSSPLTPLQFMRRAEQDSPGLRPISPSRPPTLRVRAPPVSPSHPSRASVWRP